VKTLAAPLLLLIACTSQPHIRATDATDTPTREIVREAAEQAWAGLQKYDAVCAAEVREIEADGDMEKAEELASECLSLEAPAETDRTLLLDALTAWGPESATRIACYVSGINDAYAGFGHLFEERQVATEQGRSAAMWLASLAPRRAGRCEPPSLP
jgi:hypothetical protein